jgi:hypothetical protein
VAAPSGSQGSGSAAYCNRIHVPAVVFSCVEPAQSFGKERSTCRFYRKTQKSETTEREKESIVKAAALNALNKAFEADDTRINRPDDRFVTQA